MEIKKIIVPFEIKQEDIVEGDNFFIFKGHGAIFGNVDFGGDRIMHGAFIDSIKELDLKGKKLPALWQHKTTEPVGIFPSLFEDAKGLFVTGRLPKDDSFVIGRVIPQMKVGSVQELSIGYTAIEFHHEGEIRVITKARLWEISLVTIAMNELANITEMKSNLLLLQDETKGNSLAAFLKSAINKRAKDEKEKSKLLADMASAAGISESTLGQILRANIICPPIKRLQGFADVLKIPLKPITDVAKNDGCMYDKNGISSCDMNTKERVNLHLTYKNISLKDLEDKKNSDCYLAGKTDNNNLLIGGFVDGFFKALPNAIINVAAKIHLNEIDATAIEIIEVKKHINEYYVKMGLDSPFHESGTFKLDTISDFDERTLEKLFKSGVSFSNKNAKILISALKSVGMFRDETNYLHRDGDDWANVLTELKSLTHTITKGSS